MKRTITWLPPGPLTEELINELIQDASDEVNYLECQSEINPDLKTEKLINCRLVRLVRVLVKAVEKVNPNHFEDEDHHKIMAEILQGRVDILEKIVTLKEDRFTSEFPENPSRLPFRKRNRN